MRVGFTQSSVTITLCPAMYRFATSCDFKFRSIMLFFGSFLIRQVPPKCPPDALNSSFSNTLRPSHHKCSQATTLPRVESDNIGSNDLREPDVRGPALWANPASNGRLFNGRSGECLFRLHPAFYHQCGVRASVGHPGAGGK